MKKYVVPICLLIAQFIVHYFNYSLLSSFNAEIENALYSSRVWFREKCSYFAGFTRGKEENISKEEAGDNYPKHQ
jgi:hypothetical protein